MIDEAPKEIWAFAPDIFNNMSVWQDQPSPDGDATKYLRADHAHALVAEAYEVAAEVCQDVGISSVNLGRDSEDVYECFRTIRTLTPADAITAREARDAEVREQALRDALQRIADLKRGHSEDVDEGHEQAYRTIEALTEKDKPNE